MKNYADTIVYKKYFEQYNYIFDKTYFVKREKYGLTETYHVIIEHFNHTYEVSKGFSHSVNCQQVDLYDKKKGLIYSCKNVWGDTSFQYLKHSNDNEYFICGNDLLDYYVFNVSKNLEHHFASEYNFNKDTIEECDSEFWYLTKWLYNPRNNLMAINGQDYMNCQTVTVCDFTNPESLPLRFKNLWQKIAEEFEDGTCNAIRWTENDNLQLEVCEESSKTTYLSEKEIRELLM